VPRPRNADDRPSREARASKRFAALSFAFGAAVKVTREALHVTRESVAALSSLDVRHLQRIESGEMNVTLATVLRLADALNMPVHMLFVTVEVLRQYLARPESKALARSARNARIPIDDNIQYAQDVGGNTSGSLPPEWVDPEVVLLVVGKRIGELRAARGLSQGQLAKRAKLTQQHLQRIESGLQNVTVRSLARVCIALDVHPGWLFWPERRSSP
jgi:transcriptional regulator with XRE-family HTH domain